MKLDITEEQIEQLPKVYTSAEDWDKRLKGAQKAAERGRKLEKKFRARDRKKLLKDWLAGEDVSLEN